MLNFQATTSGTYRETTQEITVSVEPQYLSQQSNPGQGQYVWAYHVRIENGGSQTVQLMSRHWRITDARGQIQEIVGDGVVGKQPVLNPGDHFDYTSGTPLSTPSGFMAGTYHMETLEGARFDIAVPTFSLDSPHVSTPLH